MIRDNPVQQMQMLSVTEKQGSQAALGDPEVSRENRVCCLSCHTEQLLEDCKKLQEKGRNDSARFQLDGKWFH